MQRFQNSENSTTGPNAAPKPAHAKDTTRNTELEGSHARMTPITAMTTTVSRATIISVLLFSLMPKTFWERSCETLEAAVSSWLSAVDMVAARIPERIIPATMASNVLLRLIRSASLMIMVSASALLVRNGTLPATETLYPMIPMAMAIIMEMTTQTVAIRREVFSFFSSLMAMNRSRIWGIPK